MYFAQAQGPNAMPVNATNQQGSSVQGANTGMLGSMFGMGLGGFGGGFSPSGFSMPQMGYGGMGGYGGGFGGMGGYGGFGGFGMPQMGYGGFGGMGGYGGGFGMPQMGFGLGSFGPQMGFGGYGNYGGFQPPQYGTTDYKSPYLRDQMWAYQQNQQRNANQQPPPGMKLNPSYDAGYAMADDMPLPGSEEALRKQRFIPDDNPPSGMIKNPYYRDRFSDGSMQTMDMRFSDSEYVTPDHLSLYEKEREESRARYGSPNPSTGGYGRGQIDTNDMVFINDPVPGGAYIPDETGQYDPNRGSFSSGPIAPTPISSSSSAPVAEPLSVAGPPKVTQEIIGTPIPVNSAPINQPRRMRNSMNMGIGSFYGGIGPGNFRNFYTP